MKECIKCKITKEYTFFYKDKKSKDGYKYKCKSCVKEYRLIYNKLNQNKFKEYNYNNREKISNQKKIYYVTNKEKFIPLQKEWKINNPEKLKIYEKKHRLKNKIHFQIKNSINCRIWGGLQNDQSSKTYNSEEYLGCKIEYYKTYLNSLFLPEMNWGNFGKVWEIDHIKPIISFDLTDIEQQKQCFNYTNTQPLFKTTEISKQYGYKDKVGNRNKPKK